MGWQWLSWPNVPVGSAPDRQAQFTDWARLGWVAQPPEEQAVLGNVLLSRCLSRLVSHCALRPPAVPLRRHTDLVFKRRHVLLGVCRIAQGRVAVDDAERRGVHAD